MVGDHTHPHVIFGVGAVAAARESSCPVEHRADLVDLVNVLYALLEEGNPLESHTGVDILLRKVAEDRKVVPRSFTAQVLHEDEIPDFDEAVAVLVQRSRRPASAARR